MGHIRQILDRFHSDAGPCGDLRELAPAVIAVQRVHPYARTGPDARDEEIQVPVAIIVAPGGANRIGSSLNMGPELTHSKEPSPRL